MQPVQNGASKTHDATVARASGSVSGGARLSLSRDQVMGVAPRPDGLGLIRDSSDGLARRGTRGACALGQRCLGGAADLNNG